MKTSNKLLPKYTATMEELLDDNEILSHLFLECTDNFVLDEIAKGNKNLTKDEFRARKVSMELTFAGYSVDPRKFFKALYEQYEEQVKRAATKMVLEQTGGILNNISNTFSELEDKVREITSNLDWDTSLIEK